MQAEGAAILLLAFVSAKRKRKGVKWCRETVMEVRASLGMDGPGVLPTQGVTALGDATQLLSRYCHTCGRCDLGK